MKKTSNRTAVYPGTFDPVTYGHLDILKRACKLFDNVIISVSKSSSKNTIFTADERVKMIGKLIANFKNARVESFEGLLVDYAKKCDAGFIIRGLRSVPDFDYEFQMALTNRRISPDTDTVFLMPSEKYSFISSTLVREIALLGSDVSSFVPPSVARAIAKKF